MERNFRDRVMVNDISISYKDEEIAQIESVEIKMGLFDLFSFLIKGKTKAEIVAVNGEVKLTEEFFNSFSSESDTTSENNETASKDSKYSFSVKLENIALTVLDKWRVEGISASMDIIDGFDNISANLKVPEINLKYDDYSLSLKEILLSLNMAEGLKASLSLDSASLSSSSFNINTNAVVGNITAKSLSSIKDLEGSLTLNGTSLSIPDGEVSVNPISVIIGEKGVELKLEEIKGRFQDAVINAKNAVVKTEDFKELSARIEGASGQYQEIPFTLDNISIPSISLYDKKAELKFQSLKINSLENLTSNIFTKVELDNGSLSLDYNEGIKIALGLDSIISPKSNVSGDILIGFDVELAFGDNTLQSFSVVSRDMYLGYGEKKDNSLVIKGDIDKAQLILEYGKINLDLLLGFNDKSFNGKMDLSDYPISVIYALLKDYSVDVDKYIPSTSSISCSLDVNGKYSELSKLFFQGDISYSVDLSSIKYGEIETYIKSKGDLSFKDESVVFSSIDLNTKYFSLLLSGNLPYSNMLPSLSFSLNLPEGDKGVKGSLILSSETSYDFSIMALSTDDTSIIGKLNFQEGIITGSSTLTTLGTKRPFIFNVDLNEKTFGASSSKIGLNGSFSEGIYASLLLRRLDIVRDGKGNPMLIDGDIEFAVNNGEWRIDGEGINLENLWFIPSSPNIKLNFTGDKTAISVPELSISTNDVTYFNGKLYFDLSTFDLSGSLDGAEGGGDVVFSFTKDTLYSGFIRARNLDLTPFGIRDMYLNMNLTGRASRIADISMEGNVEALAYDSVNDDRKLTADLAVNGDSLLLDNIIFSNSGFSIEIDSIDWNSIDGELKIGEGRFRMKGEHVDRDYPISADFNLLLVMNDNENLYTSLYNILRDGGEGIELSLNLKSLDIDNSRILVENKSTSGLIRNRRIDFTGSLISGWFDFDNKTFDLDIDVHPLAALSIKGDLNEGINANANIRSFNMYFINVFMNPPYITFDECFLKGEAGILAKDGIYNLNGNLYTEEMGVNIFWVPDQKVIVHNPTFTLWNNDLRCSVSKATVIDYETYERKTIDMCAGLTLTPTLSIEGYVAEIWMDENNPVRIRVPLPMMNIDILANGYGHYYMKTTEGEPMNNDGELNVIDSVVTIGMNPYPEWYNLRGSANVDMTINFERNNRIIYPAQADPIISITLDEDSTVTFVKKGSSYSVQGDVDIRGGEIFYFQKYFYITEGNISFPDPSKLDPKINLRATLRDYDSDSNRVEVYLVMKDNTFGNINPTLESSPAKDLNEIMEILGQSILPSSTYGTVSVGSVTQLVTEGIDILGRLGIVTTSNPISGMNQSLKEVFGVDSFSLHSNIVNNILSDTISSSLTDNYSTYSPMARYLDGTTLNIGKYLSSNFYLQGMIHLSANKNSNDKYTFIADDLVLDTEFSLEWMNPAFKITFMTSPSYFSLYSVMDTFSFSISKTINF